MADNGSARRAAHDALLGKISSLSNWVVDVGPKLSSRDQEGYSNNIRTLQTHLRAHTNPAKKSRFKFKSRLPPPSPNAGGTAGSSPGDSPALSYRLDPRHHLHYSLPNAIDSDSDVLPTDRPPAPTSVSRAAVAPPSHSVIADEVGKTLDLPSYPGRPVTLTGLHDCVVRNMSDTKIPALYVKQIRGCVIDGGWVVGSVFLQDVEESAVFVRGRQVRVHETRNTALVVDVTSQPVVEDCTGVKFYELDGPWLKERYGEEGENEGTRRVARVEVAAEELAKKDEPVKKEDTTTTTTTTDNALVAEKGMKNRWNEVLDFKWHKDGPSPNWTALRREDVQKREKESEPGKAKFLSKDQLDKFLRTGWSRLDILRTVGVEIRRGSFVGRKPSIVIEKAQ